MSVRSLTVLALCALLIPLAGCGDDPKKDVRTTLDGFATAIAKKDWQRICVDIFSAKLVDQVRQTLPCEVALQRSTLNKTKNPKIVVGKISVKGSTAHAQITTSADNQPPSKDTAVLVKQKDGWRIQALSS